MKGSSVSSSSSDKKEKKDPLNMKKLTSALDDELINYEIKDNKITFSFSNEEEIATFTKFFL